jgi:hypothetical protein
MLPIPVWVVQRSLQLPQCSARYVETAKQRHTCLAELDCGGHGPEPGDAVLLTRVVGDMGRCHGLRPIKFDKAVSAIDWSA